MSLLPPIPQQADVTDEKGKLSPIWARFFQQLLTAFGGSVISYPITITNGGTGQTTQQGALDALAGSQTAGKFLRGDGTHVSMQTIQAADVPILNQNTTGSAGSCVNFSGSLAGDVTGTQGATSVVRVNGGVIPAGATLVGTTAGGTFADASSALLSNSTTGNASNVTGTVAIANGGTGQTSANAALNALLPTQASNSGRYLKTDGTNASWATVSGGSGGGAKNYLSTYLGNTGNGDFETGATTGWSLFNTTLTSKIPTGSITSGASSVGTFSAASGAVLAGTYCLLTQSAAAWSAGQGFISDAFTIDAEDQAKVLSISFAYKVGAGGANLNFSGTSNNTFAVYVYDVTNSAWIQPAGVYNMVQSSGSGKCTATFQTTSNSTQYRLAVIAVNASGGGVAMYWDDFTVSPQTVSNGPAMSDWNTNYTFTPNNFGTTTNSVWNSRRVGDSLEVEGYFLSGTVAAATCSISLPSSLRIDSTKFASGVGSQLGLIFNATGASGAFFSAFNQAVAFYDGSDTANIYFATNGSGSSTVFTKCNTSTFANSNVGQSVKFVIPIAGWSSNTVMSSDTDTRVVAASVYLNATASYSHPIVFNSVATDTHAAYSTSTGLYTCPVAGIYEVEGQITCTGTPGIFVYKNGSVYVCAGAGQVSGNPVSYTSGAIQCNAGDTLSVGNASSVSWNGGALSGGSCNATFKRISGPAVVTAAESVNAKYYATGNTTSTTSVPINFDTKVYDSHNATTTGASWKYTAPVSGKYTVTGFANAGSGTNSTYLYLYKNGSVYEPVDYSPAINSNVLTWATSISLQAGDYIDLRCGTSSVISGNATQSNVTASRIEILRTGN